MWVLGELGVQKLLSCIPVYKKKSIITAHRARLERATILHSKYRNCGWLRPRQHHPITGSKPVISGISTGGVYRPRERERERERPNGFSRGDVWFASDRAAGCAQQVRNRTEISGYYFVPFVIRPRSFYPSRWITFKRRGGYVTRAVRNDIDTYADPLEKLIVMGSRYEPINKRIIRR